jgi:hypothetical protein
MLEAGLNVVHGVLRREVVIMLWRAMYDVGAHIPRTRIDEKRSPPRG